jgi:HAD superfamily hydrolase (TIGR01509 family)
LKRLSELFPAGGPAAVIWDMDGVLCATMDLHFQALRMACAARSLFFPEEITSIGVGRTDRANLDYILSKNDIPAVSGEISPLISNLLNEKENILFGLLKETQLKTSPGVEAWLKVLESKKIPCAVASSSTMSTIVLIVERLGITRYFSAVISGARLLYGKPDPEIFVRAAGALNAVPDHCLVIEDAPLGVEAALGAGMKCLALGTTVPLEMLSRADIIVPGLDSYPLELAFGRSDHPSF